MNLLKKLWNYYKYNGFFNTIERLLKKINIKKTKIYKDFNDNLCTKDTDLLYLKDKGNIYIFATVPYYDVGGGQRSSQLSKIFNSLGFNVNYIYAYESSESKILDMEIPLTMHMSIKNFDKEYFIDNTSKKDIIIFEAPIKEFKDYLVIGKNNGASIVYENIDNWETSLGSMFFDEDTLKEMLDKADMITATAKLLVEQTKKYFKKYNLFEKEVHYIANAVNDELFNPNKEYTKPSDIYIGKKTLTYYGSLWGEWFDWSLLEDIAIENKDIQINLIGDFSAIKNKISKLPKNIHFLGIKKQTDLPSYLAYTDFAILPFKCGNIGNYVSPLKIFEYISMNKLVLATELPDINQYPNVFQSNLSSEWSKIINSNYSVDIDKRNDFINENNWYNRCINILNITNKLNNNIICSEFYNNISVIVLNYNNKNVIFKNIDTLLKNNKRYKYEIIVVDNQSTDGSFELLKSKYGNKIKLIRNNKNGCSSGRNLGVKVSKNNYIVFLDSDQWILHGYWLDNYIDIFKKNSNIGAIGWGAGWFNKKGYAYKVVDGFINKYMPPKSIARKDIGYLATCGFMMKKDVFNSIHGFDINYDPTGYEDTDLSLSIRNLGLETLYCNYLGVGHLPHQTTKSGTDEHTKLLQQKGEYFVNKWKKTNKNLLEKYVK